MSILRLPHLGQISRSRQSPPSRQRRTEQQFPRGAEADDEPAALNAGKEWSDPELNELGDMLVRGLPMEEIARLLLRGHGEVQDKVVEIGRACR
jgi:hypothetical protein